VAYIVENRNSERFLVGKPKRTKHLLNQRVFGGIIFKCFSERQDGLLWNGFSFFRIRRFNLLF
jgi:hypothetical protein